MLRSAQLIYETRLAGVNSAVGGVKGHEERLQKVRSAMVSTSVKAFEDGLAQFKQTEGISLKRRRDESSNGKCPIYLESLKRFAAQPSAIQAEILPSRKTPTATLNGFRMW